MDMRIVKSITLKIAINAFYFHHLTNIHNDRVYHFVTIISFPDCSSRFQRQSIFLKKPQFNLIYLTGFRVIQMIGKL